MWTSLRTKPIFLAAALLFLFLAAGCVKSNQDNAAKLGLRFVADVPLTGGTDRWDYQTINYLNDRLYISHLGSGMVTVFDLKGQRVIADIRDVPSPFGILVVPELKTVYVSSSGNQVAVIDEDSLTVKKFLPAGTTPDGIAYDPGTGKIFVSDENAAMITVIDAGKNEFIGNIPFGGRVGNTQYDPVSGKIYSVSGVLHQLAEIDPVSDKIVRTWDLPDAQPHGVYIDSVTHLAFIACQSESILLVFDLGSGKIVSTQTIGQDADVLAFDPGLRRLYIAAESGVLTVFSVDGGTVVKLAGGFIADKAHTIAVDKNTHRIYLPLENVDGKPVMRILEPVP